jgi:hypothetical protein
MSMINEHMHMWGICCPREANQSGHVSISSNVLELLSNDDGHILDLM